MITSRSGVEIRPKFHLLQAQIDNYTRLQQIARLQAQIDKHLKEADIHSKQAGEFIKKAQLAKYQSYSEHFLRFPQLSITYISNYLRFPL